MSQARVPRQSRSPQNLKPPPRTPTTPTSSSRTSSPLPVGASTPRARTKSLPKSPSRSPGKAPQHNELPPLPKVAPLSIREAIAMKRAEVKKAAPKSAEGVPSGFEGLQDISPTSANKTAEDEIVDLGRWSVKETIERARNTGSVNLSSRSLPCLPSALFEIHLGITPETLKSVPKEPPLVGSIDTPGASRREAQREKPSWFEAQDLQILKAWSNDIIEIQHEISLFGSLKVIDFHQNKIASLPETFADLSGLTSLDLSHNQLQSLPPKIFALPNLTILILSHNELTALPFSSPFSANARSQLNDSNSGGFFTPVIMRASTPLPVLTTLDVSHNKISAHAIDHGKGSLPISLTKLDLSSNPLGSWNSQCRSLIQALSRLEKLKELRMEAADIGNDDFPSDLLSFSTPLPFRVLKFLHLGETKVTPDVAQAAMKSLKRELSFDWTTEDAPEGTVRVVVGKKVVKEPWEIEAERRTRLRAGKTHDLDASAASKDVAKDVIKEPWEIEAEQGLLTEGGRRRARAAAAAASTSLPKAQLTTKRPAPTERIIVKEAWEIDAEQGLLTEGGRRRARIAAAISKSSSENREQPSNSSDVDHQNTLNQMLANPQYYTASTQTLTLPSLAPPSKAHSRSFSLAAPTSSWSSLTAPTSDIALPTASVPLALVTAQPFAEKLRVLILANRRMDRSFSLPPLVDGRSTDGPLLPNLEELSLEGCGFSDTVPISRQDTPGSAVTPQRINEPLLPLLARLFPSLRTLDLSYNVLTSASITTDILSTLVLSAPGTPDDLTHPPRKGLRHLRLRGNKLTELDGLQGVALLFKGNRDVPAWKLDELDLRDNEIGKLPPELGLMPLDVFLVDGNLFRVPQRRVWEREGTKGLLSWLRGRIE